MTQNISVVSSDDTRFQGRNPIVREIHRLYYDEKGQIKVSASVIAAKLGLTRNAVLGYMSRNRDLFPLQSVQTPKKYGPRKTSRTTVSVSETRVIDRVPSIEPPELIEVLDVEHVEETNHVNQEIPEQISETISGDLELEGFTHIINGVKLRGISLLDVKSDQCRFIVKHNMKEREFLMCGQKITDGSYCTFHSKLSYSPRGSIDG